MVRGSVLLTGVVLVMVASWRPGGTRRGFAVVDGMFETRGHSIRRQQAGATLVASSLALDVSRNPVLNAIQLVLLLLAATVLGVLLWRDSALRLRPEGILVRRAVGRPVRIAWAELSAGHPRRPGLNDLMLPVTRRESPTLGQPRYLSLGWQTHPWFLADAIRWYADHPEDRAGIGTQAEHDRLVAALPEC
ncbi:hypothetical protein QEZ54_27870 [Catellatospora sp. KI3]|uniref:hypothetical protein n=1 Tax=Catellatospora sp. KI3 TaxID=3041620 RepID=UPI0024829698|nr:hypothetical protein [Catellatospora sp. KI3]MDI1464795.1 hypothetical protein [Catellatospora sp. KI3]